MRRDFDIDLWNGPVEDQKRSGRCWIYASLNPFRQRTGAGFSTNYIYYFDQLRKSEAFLNHVIALRDKPLHDPTLSAFLREPTSNVGQWCYFASIVEEHGLAPLDAMPDTAATEDGMSLTWALNERLRRGAWELRERNADPDVILRDIQAILQKFLGAPPERFQRNGEMLTPLAFYRSCGINLGDYVTLLHHPSPRWPENRAYCEQENSIDPFLTHLSVDMETMKALVLRQLQDGEQVVIGCDVRHCGSRRDGILDLALAGNEPRLSKAEAIAYREINACHIMSIDGWAADGCWKVQDSHGGETGPDGHYVMTDRWFDEYVLSAVVKKAYLSPEQRNALTLPAYMPKTERF